MIEKIYFAQGLTNPTAVEYCTALRDAFITDSDLSEWFDVSEVGTSKFTVTLKGTSVSFDMLYSTAWFYAQYFKDYTGASVSGSSSLVYHNLNTEYPLFKIITENSAAIMFESTGDAKNDFLVGFSKAKNIDDNVENTLVYWVNGSQFAYFSEDISRVTVTAPIDKRGSYDNYICIPWFPQNAGYMCKDLFRYDGGRNLLARGFYDIDGSRFVPVTKGSNILLKCD